MDLAGDKRISWRYEQTAPAGTADDLIAAVASADLPHGRGHAYLAGEASLVLALKAALLSRGWDADQVSAKAYWNRGRANADRGEPEQRACYGLISGAPIPPSSSTRMSADPTLCSSSTSMSASGSSIMTPLRSGNSFFMVL